MGQYALAGKHQQREANRHTRVCVLGASCEEEHIQRRGIDNTKGRISCMTRDMRTRNTPEGEELFTSFQGAGPHLGCMQHIMSFLKV